EYHAVIRMFRGARLNDLPMHCVTKRWLRNCKRDNAYDNKGNLLMSKATSSMDASIRRKRSTSTQTRQEEQEIFIGCSIPNDV
ncbi:hypothetical protein U9M48_002573, partial [Paspalum notatum var. saurae]